MYMSECVHASVHVHICVSTLRDQNRVSHPLELKIQEVLRHLCGYYEPNPSPLEAKVLLIAEPPLWLS